MNRILVDIVLGKAENIEELMQQESAMVAQWKDMDLVEHLFLKNSEIGAILIFKNIDIEKAKDLISQLPLFSYFSEIEYVLLDKKF